MPNNIVHFAIHADDVKRAQRFYEGVFGWRFEAWGPPGFYLVHTGNERDPGIHGALHKRLEPVTGKGMTGYECTIGVDDVDRTAAAVEANGGTIVMPKCAIPTVGWLIKFLDTEGNLACAIRFDKDAA